MRSFGLFVAVAGLAVAAYFGFLYDTHARIGGSLGSTNFEFGVTDPDRVDARRNGVMLGLGGLIAGGAIVATSGRRH